MNCTRIYLFLICWGLSLASAQISFETPVMPSPTAASLGKYGDIPVSHHTGIPNIGIPIYILQEGPLSVPISLSYHGSGIRVDELASWVGLGWSLNAGGVITRTVSGTPDEGGISAQGSGSEVVATQGWYQNHGIHPGLITPLCEQDPSQFYGNNSLSNCSEYYKDAADGYIDTQPDMFTFNFGGYSGKFIFDYNRRARIIPDQDLIIEPVYAPGEFSSWKIITPDGTKFFFGGGNAIETGYTSKQNITPSAYMEMSTSWYLNRIESMNGEHWITFQYVSESYGFANRAGHTVYFDCEAHTQPVQYPNTVNRAPLDLSYTNIDGRRLSSISTSSGHTLVNFKVDPSTLREDVNKYGNYLLANTSAKSLDEIEIIHGAETRVFKLQTTYFQSNVNSANNEYGPSISSTFDTKRLKLLSVQEITPVVQVATLPNPYTFVYEESVPMARRFSLARDHWGYYNGAESNEGLLPSGIRNPCNTDPSSNTYRWYGLANREPHANKMKAWSLKEIEYPTDGKTLFEFQAHESSGYDIGGLRIGKMTTIPEGGGSPKEKMFEYSTSILYGQFPGLSMSLHPDLYINDNIMGYYTAQGYSGLIPNANAIALANPYPALRTTKGKHIGYSIVKERDGVNGETWYHYNNTISSSSSNIFPRVPSQTTLMGGRLTKIEHRDADGNVVKSEQLLYIEEKDPSVVEARVVVSMDIETGNPNGYPAPAPQYVNFYRDYEIHLGRVILDKKIEIMDGLVTETDYFYSAEHNFPIKTAVVNTDGRLYETVSHYFDQWFSSACVLDPGPCEATYQADVTAVRSQYETITYHQGSTGAQIPEYTVDPTDVPAFQAALHQAQVDYLACRQTTIDGYNTCQQTELNNFSTSNPTHSILSEMIQRNFISALENIKMVDGVAVEGSKIVYEIDNYATAAVQNHLVPAEYLRLISGNWNPEVNVKYDQHDNLIEYTQVDGQANSMLFSHDHRLPVASVANATHDEIAYTSFEDLPPPGYTPLFEDGNWLIERDVMGGYNATAQTGRRGFVLQPNYQVSIPEGNLPAGKYVVSFWYSGAAVQVETQDGTVAPSDPNYSSSISSPTPGSDLTYFETELEVSALGTVILTDASGGGVPTIDELRLYPIDAQMSTISYDYAYRVHTKTDVNNRSQYHEYDELGRLIIVKDQDRNIVQTTDYYYKQ